MLVLVAAGCVARRSLTPGALELNPNLAAAWDNRASCFMALGDPEAALGDVERALELDPSYTLALIRRARLRVIVHRDLPGAIADTSRALELNPKLGDAYAIRALVY